MKKTLLILVISFCINRLSAQGSLQVTAGANITGSGASWIVLNDMNVVNNGSILLSTSGNTVKTTGTLNTTVLFWRWENNAPGLYFKKKLEENFSVEKLKAMLKN